MGGRLALISDMASKAHGDAEKGGYVDVADNEEQLQRPQPIAQPKRIGFMQRWTPTALLLSYFVFSIAFYTVLDDYSCKVFWFLYRKRAKMWQRRRAMAGSSRRQMKSSQ